MGKSSTQNTLKFVLDLLSLIPAASRALDAQTLTKQLEDRGHFKNQRTVQRTLKDIQTHYPTLECRDQSKPFGWSWSAKALPISVPAMSLDQAIVLTLAERVLPGSLPGNVQRAISPVRKNAARRSAVSAAIEPLPGTISLMRRRPMLMAGAKAYGDIPIGFSNSTERISSGVLSVIFRGIAAPLSSSAE